MSEIRVLLVDDQVLFVESLKTVLEVHGEDIRVVGIAHDGTEALRLIEQTEPDMVLMDVRMPGMDGVQAVGAIARRFPRVKVMMLTTFDDDEYVYEALRGGAVGYLLKNIPPEELVTSIRSAKQGGVLISPSVARKLVAARPGAGSADRGLRDEPVWLARLSAREREILRLLARGWSNRIIAERLYVAEQTVKNHLSVIYAKMQVRNRQDAMQLIERENPEMANPGPKGDRAT